MLVVLAAIGIPAAVLTATCAGRSCDASGGEAVRVPFCPLPDAMKEGVVNGFREGRSPDVLAVADGTPIVTDVDGASHAVAGRRGRHRPTGADRVRGRRGDRRRERARRDDARPHRADGERSILGFERAFPEVRSGTAVAGRRRRRDGRVWSCWWVGRASARPSSKPIGTTGRSSSSLLDEGVGDARRCRRVRCRSTRRRRSRRSGPAVCRRSTGSPARSSGTARAGSCRPTRPMRPCRSSRRSPTTSTTRTHRPSSASSRPTSAIAGSWAATGTRARIPSTR